MSSFYGGVPGEPFFISNFLRVHTKGNKQGIFGTAGKNINNSLSTTVFPYNTYVMIYPESDEDQDYKGNIYYRDLQGIRFVGNICGPRGLAPTLTLATKTDIASDGTESQEVELSNGDILTFKLKKTTSNGTTTSTQNGSFQSIDGINYSLSIEIQNANS